MLLTPPLDDVQNARLERFSAEHSVDIHCHCLPDLDDGPATLAEAVALCRALVADGVTAVIATPHQLGDYEGVNPAAAVRAATAALQQQLQSEGIPLQVRPGGDIRVDERLIELLNASQALSLADEGRYLLLELPHDNLLELEFLTRELVSRGITPILSHPERHDRLARNFDRLLPWMQAGLLLQVTAGSLIGQFGGPAKEAAWTLLSAGLVSIVASDAHDVRRRPPSMTAALAVVTKRLGHAVARRLCIENPLHVWEGTPIKAPSVALGRTKAFRPASTRAGLRRFWQREAR